MPLIRIEYSPVHELVTSLFAYTDHKNHLHDLGNKWRKEIRKNLSESFEKKLEDLDLCEIITYLHLVIVDSPEKQNVESFLAWFADLGEGQLYEMLAPHLEEGISMGLKAFRDLSLEILTEWHRVCPISQEIHELLERSASRMKQLNEQVPYIDLIDEATSGIVLDPVDEYDTILLIPAYHIKPLNRMDFVNSRLFVINYAVDDEQTPEDTPTHQLLRMTKGLADEKRLVLLHILAGGPVTFTELQQKTGLSKSNLHYHLSLLKTAGLLRMHFKKPNEKYKYSARPESFDQLKALLESYVFGIKKNSK
ncbi:ArsR/SmtB family transcription factor [Paenibacillus sp. DMB20]|uniref:ArsR/SmtB family transcription factor n=1 Tax=Paenibacillus sp. DMB20 TaxID=1642570 RepID=UPI000627717D|nr:winged helix-turn-helix domain-containing protein [Paenibacillus sp. DMB20]KKO54838.1 ArsR family transcriptional regulator [Paenibacillus sp. DMB20]